MAKDTSSDEVFPILVSPARAAEMLGISVWSMHKLIQAGEVESGKSGGRRLVKVSSLHAYADKIVKASA